MWILQKHPIMNGKIVVKSKLDLALSSQEVCFQVFLGQKTFHKIVGYIFSFRIFFYHDKDCTYQQHKTKLSDYLKLSLVTIQGYLGVPDISVTSETLEIYKEIAITKRYQLLPKQTVIFKTRFL